jgi:hypothetical protein
MPSLIESPLSGRYFDSALAQQAMPEFLVKFVPDENKISTFWKARSVATKPFLVRIPLELCLNILLVHH